MYIKSCFELDLPTIIFMQIWKKVSNILTRTSSRLVYKNLRLFQTGKILPMEENPVLYDNLRFDTDSYEVYMVPKHL